MPREKERKYTVGSLFAGVGGICLGFQQAGFKVIWANEWDKQACVTYRANFRHKLLEGDIHEIDPEVLPKVDVVTSGFPCQAFSIAGYRKGFTDHRGNLFFETMRFIDEIQPKAFLLENVRNLMGHDKGRTFAAIKERIKASGYSFMAKVLNSMEYGNVPQNRERIYIVGFRDEATFIDEESISNICSSAFKFPNPAKLTKGLKDILEKGRTDSSYYYNDSKYYAEFKDYEWSKNTVYQWRRVYLRENKKNVCPTLTANMGAGGHNVPLILDDYDIRKLTPRECFSFQGFPKRFILPRIANCHLYKQAGNSVTVPVIKRIAKRMLVALNAKYSSNKLSEKEKLYA